MQPVPGEFGGKRFDTEYSQHPVPARLIARDPVHHPEAAWIGIAQDPVGEDDIHVVMALGWRAGWHETKIAGHAQMNEQPTAAPIASAIEEKIFAPAPDVLHPATGQHRAQLGGHRAAQARLAHRHPDDTAPSDPGQHPMAADFHFRQFRHLVPPTKPQ